MLSPRAKVAGILALSVAGFVAAAEYLPRLRSFLPHCPVHELTSLHCPGCGSTRMLLALLHGDFATALGCNPLALAFVSVMGAWGLWQVWHGLRHNRFAEISLPAATGRWVLWIVCAFAVARNLPWEPFRWLAPGA